MKIFKLNKKAYHSLENRHEVNISEAGHIVQTHDPRITYHIKLDEENLVWVYCTYTTKRNEFREFIKSGVYVRCQVRADFDQVSLYNTFRRKK